MARHQIKKDRHRVILRRNGFQLPNIGGPIAADRVFELRRIVHVDVLVIQALAPRLSLDLLDDIREESQDPIVIRGFCPARAHVHDEEGSLGRVKAECVTAVLLHAFQLTRSDGLDGDRWEETFRVLDCGKVCIECVHEERKQISVNFEGDVPLCLAETIGKALVHHDGKFGESMDVGGGLQVGNGVPIIEDAGICNRLGVVELSNPDLSNCRRIRERLN